MSSNTQTPPSDGLRRRTTTTSTPPSSPPPLKEDPPSSSTTAPPSPTSESNPFDCNVCFETPRDPVVTPCGHLYCWSCLYRWMRQHTASPQCPVCKSLVDKRYVIPIYGRGRPRSALPDGLDLPPRPQGHRAQPAPRVPVGQGYGVHAAFGRIHPYEPGANYENALSTFGLFPSLFGVQLAYPRVHEPQREEAPANQEDGMSELSKFSFSFCLIFVLRFRLLTFLSLSCRLSSL